MIEPTSGLLIFAKDHEKLAGFYRSMFECDVMRSSEGYTTLLYRGIELIIHALPSHIADSIEITSPPDVRIDTAIKPIFFVDSIEDTRAKVLGIGGGINDPEQEFEFFDYVFCDGADIEGNVFQVRSPSAKEG